MKRRTNSQIRQRYQAARLRMQAGYALKLTLTGAGTKGGGWRLRLNKLMRKLPKQQRGTSSTIGVKEILE